MKPNPCFKCIHRRLHCHTTCKAGQEWSAWYAEQKKIRDNEREKAKIPSIMQDAEGIWSTCPTCGNKLHAILAMKMDTYFPKYCQECGQEVKWE